MTKKETNLENKNIEQEGKVAKISGKTILAIECVICFTALAVFLTLALIASYCNISDTLRIVLIFVGLIDLLISCFIALYFETKFGYHICKKCGYKHQSSYLKTLIAPHIGWTRFMKCPKCGKRSWQKRK